METFDIPKDAVEGLVVSGAVAMPHLLKELDAVLRFYGRGVARNPTPAVGDMPGYRITRHVDCLELLERQTETAYRIHGGYPAAATSGCMAALAAKYLSPSHKTISIIGSDAVAKQFVLACNELFQPEAFRVFTSASPEIAAEFKSELDAGTPAEVAISETVGPDFLANADLLFSSEQLPAPIESIASMQPTAHISAVRQPKRNYANAVLSAMAVVVDDEAQSRAAGELRDTAGTPLDVVGNIGNAALGELRAHVESLSFYDATGMPCAEIPVCRILAKTYATMFLQRDL